MKNKKQPAKFHYFIGHGFRWLKKSMITMWMAAPNLAKRFYQRGKRDMSIVIRGFMLFCAFFVFTYGSILMIALSFYVAIAEGILLAASYSIYGLLWLIEKKHLRKISFICPECKESSTLPAYLCPSCGEKHEDMIPGKYGLVFRTCNCGKRMATTFLLRRKKYQACCPNCGIFLPDKENRTISIPVIGGRSVGKTAFINAFISQFMNYIVPVNKWEMKPYSQEKERILEAIKKDYIAGTARITDSNTQIEEASSVSYSFFLKGKKLKPERLFHIYDISGKVFVEHKEHEIQRQYVGCQGIILILDPLTIEEVRYIYADRLTQRDIEGIGSDTIYAVIDAFFNTLREVTGISVHKKLDIPLAIVINKCDIVDLQTELKQDGLEQNELEEIYKNKILKRNKKKINQIDIQDFLCQRFLRKYGMESFLNIISMKFTTYKYFACSAIGHSEGMGNYEPVGVLEPMKWIIGQKDHTIKRQLEAANYAKDVLFTSFQRL